MVVDDNVDGADMISMLLGAAGHEVLVEHSAQGALARAQEAMPDAFLLDIGLPDIDGNALAARIRAQPENAEATLIAITGYGQNIDRQRSLRAGFDLHLVKPVDTRQLMEILATVSARVEQRPAT